MSELIGKRLVDDAVDAYVDWREECVAVWGAYERWALGLARDARSAFSAYQAALNREERASGVYRRLVIQLVTRPPNVLEAVAAGLSSRA
jgi:hypothetical protein